MMGSSRRRLRSPLAATAMVVLGLAGLIVTGGPAAADVTAVSGSATALSLDGSPTGSVSGSATQAAAQNGYGPIGSGFLPSGTSCPGGGVLPPAVVPVLLSLGVLDACTRGGNVLGDNHLGFAESSTAAANVGLGGATLGVVRSACRADGNGAVGSTEIVGSSIPGLPTNPAPNTVVPLTGILPLGAVLNLTLNEQAVVNTPGTASISVNAVHLNLLGIDIVVGRSVCQATGPDVNVTTTSTTTAPPPPGPTTTTTTTAPSGGGGGGGGTTNNNTNVNGNTNPNTNDNVNPNTNTNTNPNTNTNNNVSNNTNTLTGGNNTNTNTVGGNNITINTPPAQIIFLTQPGPGGGQSQTQQQTQQQSQQQTQQLTGTVLARTGSTVQPLGAVSLLSLVFGILMLIVGRSPLAASSGFSASGAPVRWGPFEVGKAVLGALMALVAAPMRARRRRR